MSIKKIHLTHKKNYAITLMLIKYSKSKTFQNFLMSRIYKKITNNDEFFEIWEKAANNMRKNTISTKYLTAGETLTMINENLDIDNNLKKSDVSNLISKKIIYAEKIEKGRDSKGRLKVNYKIPKEEVENYIALMRLFEIVEDKKFIIYDEHPKTGEKIVVYQSLTGDKLGISSVVSKLDIVFKLIQKEEFQKLIYDLNNTQKELKL